MPRLTESVPKYRKHRATGQAVVTINGRDFYLGPHGTKASRIEYDRRITEWLASGRSPTFGAPEHVVSVVELIVAYLEHAKRYYGDGPRGAYANMLYALRPLRELYGRTPAREFGPLQLKAVREKFIALGWSRKHINQCVQRIGRVFRWGVSEGLIPPDVPQALAMIPGLRKGHTAARETKKVRPVDDKLVDATLPHLPPVVRSMVELQRATGARPCEICILRPCDVDRSGDVWEYRPQDHKNAHREMDRIIYVGPSGQDILRSYLLRDAESFCFSPLESEAKRRAAAHAVRRTPLSCGDRPGSNRVRHKPRRRAGDRYTPQSYLRAVKRASDQAFPVPDDIADDPTAVKDWQAKHRWSPNRLRHALATKVRRDFDIEAAKVLLGHSQINMSGHYAEQDRRRAIEVAKLIG
jgi:integrase